MERTKSIGMGVVAVAGVLALLLAIECGWSTRAAVAGKPAPPATTIVPGYLLFRDAAGDYVRSDGRGQYADLGISQGEDQVQLEISNSGGGLRRIDAILGYGDASVPYHSTRSGTLGFGRSTTTGTWIPDWGTPTPDGRRDHRAVYDILQSVVGGDRAEFWYIPVDVSGNSGSGWVQFTVDRITQEAVDGLYPDDVDYIYSVPSDPQYQPQGGTGTQIIYNVLFMPFAVQVVGWDSAGRPRTWKVTAQQRTSRSPVPELGVWRRFPDGTKNDVYLSKFSQVPFAFEVSLDPLSGWR